MWPQHPEARPGTYPPLPLFDGEKIIKADVTADDQSHLTRQYTDCAVRFIERNRARPFFFYLAHSMPHVPLFAEEAFQHKSKQGLYGDVIQEIDDSVGRVLDTIRRNGLDRDTLIIFTSDNGPWLSYGNHAGSSGPLREGKGTVWEGGVRVPFVARWPGHIPSGSVCNEPAMAIDILPTCAALTDAPLPSRPIDGKDITPLLTAKPGAHSPQEAYWFYYNTDELQAIRSGRWKLILPHTYRTMIGQPPGKDGIPGKYRMARTELALYDLDADTRETVNVAARVPDTVKRLLSYAEKARTELGDALVRRKGAGIREPGRL
jgi:arylsulfatase A